MMRTHKFLLFPLFSLFSLFSLFFVPQSCHALDKEGCLTCHQYPGLVTFLQPDELKADDRPLGGRFVLPVATAINKSNEFKVVHLDEGKYVNSPHGKFRCRRCHIKIWKIPHAGVTQVDCTSQCHQQDAVKIVNDTNYLQTIHEKEQSFIAQLVDKSSCRVCHPLYPHSKDKIVRALCNMHTGFMLCDVCHIKRDHFKPLTYEWYDTENATFRGEPFGSYYNPKVKNQHKDEHFITRIAVFTTKEGQKRSLMNTWDLAEAERFMRQEPSLSADEKEKQLAFFHRDIDKKELSIACEECHSSKSILDFKKLGFNEKKISHLININIKGLLTKYKDFYFPRLLKK